MKSSLLLAAIALLALTGCEKVTNQAKNLQSDWVGLKRVVEIRSCFDGKLIKRYEGVVRLNPEDQYGASLLIDGKKLHTNMCYIIREQGLREQPIGGGVQ
ncbi:hypothetical protein [Sulfurivirga sp.]|uniref:hypothetical protein n=1 Tax=Sulfurivirga sp. TaxID=2614236 RepID=UPI0025F83E8B|nr:hypothetical protein [Sulfurivirga sp.]